MKKSIVCIALALCLVVGMSIGALAATSTEKIEALMNYGIQIKYNGVAQKFTDVNGKQVYPISYKGTTYLPVRAVSGLVGLAVDWDGANNTVILGERDYRVDFKPEYVELSYGNSCYTTDKSDLVVDGEAYDSGIRLAHNTAGINFDNTVLRFQIPTEYQKIHFIAQNNGSTSCTVKLTQGKNVAVVYKTIELAPGEAQVVEADILGCDSFNFRVCSPKANCDVSLVDVYFT